MWRKAPRLATRCTQHMTRALAVTTTATQPSHQVLQRCQQLSLHTQEYPDWQERTCQPLCIPASHTSAAVGTAAELNRCQSARPIEHNTQHLAHWRTCGHRHSGPCTRSRSTSQQTRSSQMGPDSHPTAAVHCRQTLVWAGASHNAAAAAPSSRLQHKLQTVCIRSHCRFMTACTYSERDGFAPGRCSLACCVVPSTACSSLMLPRHGEPYVSNPCMPLLRQLRSARSLSHT